VSVSLVCRYIVAASDTQATFTGSQQRAGVYALPFAVNGIFRIGRPRPPSRTAPPGPKKNRKRKTISDKGKKARRKAPVGGGGDGLLFKEDDPTDEEAELPVGFKFDWAAYRAKFGKTPIQDAVTTLFAEYASLYARISGWTTSSTLAPMTLEEGKSIADQATNFVVKVMSPILGYVHTSKVHKLLAHVMDAIKYHGSLSNGNTASNESAHKDDKPFYRRTNMNMATYTQQLVRQAQGTRDILRRHAAADEHARRTLPLVPPRRKGAGAGGATRGGGMAAGAGTSEAPGGAAAARSDEAPAAPVLGGIRATAGNRASATPGGVAATGRDGASEATGAGDVGDTARNRASVAPGGAAAADSHESSAALASGGVGYTGGNPELAAPRGVGAAMGGHEVSAATGSGSVTGAGRRPVTYVPKFSIRDLAKRPGLARLGALFGLPPDRKVPVLSTVEIKATFDCGARGKQLLRAAPKFKTG